MRFSILLMASFAVSAWAQTQPASQEDINRALEVLRNTRIPAHSPAPKETPDVRPAPVASNPPSVQPLLPDGPKPRLTRDMERRARQLLQNVEFESPAQGAPSPAQEVIERAKARDELRKQAIDETRRGLPQEPSSRPATLAEEQQRKAQEEIEREKNLQRIEMEVQRARIAREQKAQAAAAKTNTAPPAVAITPALPAAPVAPAPQPPAVATQPPPAPAPQAPKPQPVPAPQPVTPKPAPAPVVVQQAPAPTPVPLPQTAPAPQAQPGFKGLAPDMEQRARDILNQVIANTKDASLPPLATQPPKAAAIIPPPQPVQPQPANAAAPALAPVRGPDAPAAPAIVAAPTTTPATAAPIPPDQEARARELLNKVLAESTPALAPTTIQKPQAAPAPAPAVTARPTQPAPVVPRPALPSREADFAPIPPDQEARARELLNKMLAQPAPAAAPATTTIVAKPPEATPMISKPVVPLPGTGPSTPLPPDQEAKAREVLNQTIATLPPPAPAPAPTETSISPELDRRAQEDARRQAKLKAEIEEQTRREIARMEEESQTRAREIARRRLEEEKRAPRRSDKAEPAPTSAVSPAITAVRRAPEPIDSRPAPVKSAEKPRRGKSDTDAKGVAKPPLEETWKDAGNPREQRLAELLEAYRKDQISAQQYHSERAKILAVQ